MADNYVRELLEKEAEHLSRRLAQGIFSSEKSRENFERRFIQLNSLLNSLETHGGRKMFALIVQSKEVRANSGDIMTASGEEFLVKRDVDGWVSATGVNLKGSLAQENGKFSIDTKIFASFDEAQKFAAKWKGQPWWVKPNGFFRVVPVKELTEQIVIGYAPDCEGDLS